MALYPVFLPCSSRGFFRNLCPRELLISQLNPMAELSHSILINKQGEIIDAKYGITAEGHAPAVLDKLKQL